VSRKDRYSNGPILFVWYKADLLRLIERHDPQGHLYADDTQVLGQWRREGFWRPEANVIFFAPPQAHDILWGCGDASSDLF
jgi:hypothetical protein